MAWVPVTHGWKRALLALPITAVIVLLLGSCSSSAISAPTYTPPATAAPLSFASVPGIVDPTNHGWPRQVRGLNGLVTVKSKPSRIITLSVGHDEMTYGLVPADRVVAVGSSTRNPLYSNVADLARNAPVVSLDPEAILAAKPDVMVTSPYIKPELVGLLSAAGLPVIEVALAQGDVKDRISDVLFLGYIYGEEERAMALAREIQQRYEAIEAAVANKPAALRPTVLAMSRYAGSIYASGAGSTPGNIIEAAGGINAAAAMEPYPVITFESIIALRPAFIILTQSTEDGGEQFQKDILSTPALADVPAVKNGRVYLVGNRYFTTLSYWNVAGIQQLANILWPADFGQKQFTPFSLPG